MALISKVNSIINQIANTALSKAEISKTTRNVSFAHDYVTMQNKSNLYYDFGIDISQNIDFNETLEEREKENKLSFFA